MFSDSELIQRILQGETDLFAEIVQAYEKPIFNYCLKMLNFHQQDAEDVTIQVFSKAYLNLASYNSKYKFSSWLYRIAHNEAINFLKKKTREWSLELSDLWPMFTELKEESFNREILDRVLHDLKSKDREVLILFYLQELSLQEISDILKISENSVAQRLKRARERAKKIAAKLNLKI